MKISTIGKGWRDGPKRECQRKGGENTQRGHCKKNKLIFTKDLSEMMKFAHTLWSIDVNLHDLPRWLELMFSKDQIVAEYKEQWGESKVPRTVMNILNKLDNMVSKGPVRRMGPTNGVD